MSGTIEEAMARSYFPHDYGILSFVLTLTQVPLDPPHVSLGPQAFHPDDAQAVVHGATQLHAPIHLRVPLPATAAPRKTKHD